MSALPPGLMTPAEERSAAARLAAMTPAEAAEALRLLEEMQRRQRQRRFDHLFPDETHEWEGQVFHARALYPKHLEAFEAGAAYRERCLMFGNRTGKTVSGAYETTCHLTGLYPDWWPGRRFDAPVSWWAAGKTNETTRDIVQHELLGPILGSKTSKRPSGTGMIPGRLFGAWTWRQGVNDLLDTIHVRHVSGGWSTLGFKSYEQGRGSFEGTAKHGIWLDEEPPADVYGECLIRTATTDGILYITFTPLAGMSDVVLGFMPQEG